MDINIKQISENEYYNSKAYDIVYNGVVKRTQKT
jgi:hypothetical protein